MYAIQNKKTLEYVYGTDYRYNPPHQRTSLEQALTYSDLNDAIFNFIRRKCGNDYIIVKVKLERIAEVVKPYEYWYYSGEKQQI